MTHDELLALARSSTTVSLPLASRALGFGSNLGYDLARRGEFPCRVLHAGRKLRVPTADLLAVLGIQLDRVAEAATTPKT
jgi:hypothetical protein